MNSRIVDRLAIGIASLAGIGFLRPAPGTWASVATALLAWPLAGWGWLPWVSTGVLIAFVGGLAAARALRATGAVAHADPGWIVVDEAAGMWLALLLAPPTPAGWLLALALFRAFDIRKPWLVGWADRRLEGAPGVMADDIIAGLLVAPIVPICLMLPEWLA